MMRTRSSLLLACTRVSVLLAASVAACDARTGTSHLLDLQPIDSIGSQSEEPFVFGHLSDAAFLNNERFVLVDGLTREVFLLDVSQRLRIRLGRRGAGPGEYQAPRNVAAIDDMIAVYDEGLGRIVTYDTSGMPQREWRVPGGFIEDMEADEARIVLTSGLEGNTALRSYGWDGTLMDEQQIGATSGVPVRPGHVCLTGHEMWYLDRTGGRAYRMSAALVPDTTAVVEWSTDASESTLPFTMGFECSDDVLAAAVMDADLATLRYFVHDRRTGTTHEFSYPRDSEGVVHGLGFLSDIQADAFLTFRTEPISMLTTVRLVGLSD